MRAANIVSTQPSRSTASTPLESRNGENVDTSSQTMEQSDSLDREIQSQELLGVQAIHTTEGNYRAEERSYVSDIFKVGNSIYDIPYRNLQNCF